MTGSSHSLVGPEWFLVWVTIGLVVVTGALACFTAYLYLTTKRLATESKKASAKALAASTEATNLARREFNATHRPELLLREVAWATQELDGGSVRIDDKIAFTLVNKGRNSCKIVESLYGLWSSDGNGRAIRPGGINRLGPIDLASGQFHEATYQIAPDDEEEGMTAGFSTEQVANSARIHGLLSPCFFRGAFIYEDPAGIRRRYVFTRICSRGSERFLPTGNPEDEYTD